MALSLTKLTLPLRYEREEICQRMEIKAFTKSNNRQNLLVLKIKFNEHYTSIIENGWRDGSPSKYFRFKADLRENDSIKVKAVHQTMNVRVTKMEKFPARYNFSQASHMYFSEFLNKDTLNNKFWKIINKLRDGKFKKVSE